MVSTALGSVEKREPGKFIRKALGNLLTGAYSVDLGKGKRFEVGRIRNLLVTTVLSGLLLTACGNTAVTTLDPKSITRFFYPTETPKTTITVKPDPTATATATTYVYIGSTAGAAPTETVQQVEPTVESTVVQEGTPTTDAPTIIPTNNVEGSATPSPVVPTQEIKVATSTSTNVTPTEVIPPTAETIIDSEKDLLFNFDSTKNSIDFITSEGLTKTISINGNGISYEYTGITEKSTGEIIFKIKIGERTYTFESSNTNTDIKYVLSLFTDDYVVKEDSKTGELLVPQEHVEHDKLTRLIKLFNDISGVIKQKDLPGALTNKSFGHTSDNNFLFSITQDMGGGEDYWDINGPRNLVNDYGFATGTNGFSYQLKDISGFERAMKSLVSNAEKLNITTISESVKDLELSGIGLVSKKPFKEYALIKYYIIADKLTGLTIKLVGIPYRLVDSNALNIVKTRFLSPDFLFLWNYLTQQFPDKDDTITIAVKKYLSDNQ